MISFQNHLITFAMEFYVHSVCVCVCACDPSKRRVSKQVSGIRSRKWCFLAPMVCMAHVSISSFSIFDMIIKWFLNKLLSSNVECPKFNLYGWWKLLTIKSLLVFRMHFIFFRIQKLLTHNCWPFEHWALDIIAISS